MRSPFLSVHAGIAEIPSSFKLSAKTWGMGRRTKIETITSRVNLGTLRFSFHEQ
ncbi:MAG: hypothetical protein WAP08_06415 [Smithellaceae bacterium]